MGFLDGLVSDLVGAKTGVNPRRLVRMVGGKNLLLMGAGAAVAGGLAAALSQRQGATGQPGWAPSGQPSAVPPPPPPGAPQVIPPPPPPPAAPPPGVDAESGAAAAGVELAPELTYAIVRTMVAAALADGHLAPEEKAAIEKHLGDSGQLAQPPGSGLRASGRPGRGPGEGSLRRVSGDRPGIV